MLFFSDKRKTDQIIHELDGNRRMADRITQRVFSSEEHLGAEVTIFITCFVLERTRCLGDILYLLYISLSVCLVILLTNVLLGSPIHYNDFQRGPRT